jgi:general secretion pathway protein A
MSEIYYGRCYGFDSPPFHVTPDPSLLFVTETHQQALGTIEYGIAAGKGFMVVTGEVGVGKTTVLKICLDKLDVGAAKIIYLFNPALSTAELYAAILDEFDVCFRTFRNLADALRALQRALLTMHEAGFQVILAVDEAQNMPEETLECLRVLSNLETATSKLLQIILVGQPELETILAKHSLRQLAQRVAVRARIKPLSLRQSCRYVQYRIQCAGRVGDRPLFTAPALLYLAATARGIPRTINICCDNALINGYGRGAKRISLSIARESCRALQVRPPLSQIAIFAAVAMVLIATAFSADALLTNSLGMLVRGKALYSSWRDHASAYNVAVYRAQAAAAPLTTNKVSPLPAPDREDTTRSSPLPGPATDRPVEGVQSASTTGPGSDAAATAPVTAGNPPIPSVALRWVVRRGDTVTKACRVIYGVCDTADLRAVFAYNPQIGSNGLIREGQSINMPERVEPIGTK